MYKKVLLSLLFVFLLFASCVNKNNEDAHKKLPNENLIGSVLNIPDTLHYLFNGTIKEYIYSNKNEIKLITRIWGDCSSCIDSLSKWEYFVSKERHTKDFRLYIFVYTSRYYYFERNIYPRINLNYPLIIDKNDKLSAINNFDLNIKYSTFLLDSNNRIILTGNPIYSKKLMELYKQEINKRLDNQ